MNNVTSTLRILTIALIIAAATTRLANAQELYFSELTTQERLAPVVPPLPEEDAKYNMALGPLRFNTQAGIGVEYNDNITLSPNGSKISDFIFRPLFELDARWPISDLNTLRFSIGASYAAYVNHPEFDPHSVLLSPNSVLAFTFYVGQVQITFRDNFSYLEDPYGVPLFSNVTTYRRFQNNVGVQLDWNVNQALKLTGGYEHYNLWPTQSNFSTLQQAINTIYMRPSYAITPTVTVGVNGSVSWVNYTSTGPDVPRDANNYLVGGFVDFGLTEYTRFNLEAGWQAFDFEDDSNHTAVGGIIDSSSANTYYIKSQVVNRLSEAFTQRLSFSKTAEEGYQTNFYNLYYLQYSADWNIMKDLVLSPNAYYQWYKTSAPDPEVASLYGFGLGLRYILTTSVTLGVDYRFALKDSNFPDSSYNQNVVFVSLYYKF